MDCAMLRGVPLSAGLVMRQIQRGVYLTGSKKLLYVYSPLKRVYPPNGLTVVRLLADNHTRRERVLTVYRNLVRLSKYLQVHAHLKRAYCELVKVKLRQDYEYRKAIFLPINSQTSVSGDDSERQLCERLVNTVNFVHNATLDNVANETARPVSMEFKILNSILQFEISKSLPSSLRGKYQGKFFNLEKYMEFRQIERSWNMLGITEGRDDNVWWIENGMLKNEICFGYLKDLKNLESNNFISKMAGSIVDFERCLVLFNEESKLIL